jgi:hypothetical protein
MLQDCHTNPNFCYYGISQTLRKNEGHFFRLHVSTLNKTLLKNHIIYNVSISILGYIYDYKFSVFRVVHISTHVHHEEYVWNFLYITHVDTVSASLD